MARKKKRCPLDLALERTDLPNYIEWVRTTPTRRLVRGVRVSYKAGEPVFILWRYGDTEPNYEWQGMPDV